MAVSLAKLVRTAESIVVGQIESVRATASKCMKTIEVTYRPLRTLKGKSTNEIGTYRKSIPLFGDDTCPSVSFFSYPCPVAFDSDVKGEKLIFFHGSVAGDACERVGRARAVLRLLNPRSLRGRPRPYALSSIETQRDLFLQRACDAGVVLPFVPTIREWTRPSFISWREDQKTVAVPNWDELSADQRWLLLRMAGDDRAAAARLFDLLFRWFLPAHELCHALQSAYRSAATRSENERTANDVAVAFHMTTTEGPARLRTLEALLVRAEQRIGPPKHNDEHFSSNYDALTRNQLLYAQYQVQFIIASLARRNELFLPRLLKNLRRDP